MISGKNQVIGVDFKVSLILDPLRYHNLKELCLQVV